MTGFPRRASWFVVAAVALVAIALAQPLSGQILGACGPVSLCLGDNRFNVTVAWIDPTSGDQQVGHPEALTSDSGYFWFFSQPNIEVTVKVVDGCSNNGHRWVFASGMTNLEVRLSVTDVQSGVFKVYTNPQGTAFLPIQDTSTFSSCPGAPAGEASGTWSGTFDSADSVDCDSNTPAQATFEQVGSAVTGTLSATQNFCGFTSVRFSGTLDGDQLAGVVTGNKFENAHLLGTVSGASLELTIANGFGFIPGGKMHLHR